MNKKTLILLTLLIGELIFANIVFGGGKIKGVFVDKISGSPVKGLSVMPLCPGRVLIPWSNSNTKGEFYLEDVPIGNCILIVSEMKRDPLSGVPIAFELKDLEGAKINIEVKSDQTVDLGKITIKKGEKIEARCAYEANEDINLFSMLPPYQSSLHGKNEVRINNPNNFGVVVGLRSEDSGKNLKVPPNGSISVLVQNGNYKIYFIYLNKPDALYQGDDFSLDNNGIEIHVMKVVGGNYSIKRVK